MPVSVADNRSRTSGGSRVAAPTHPLTHHEILGLIAPFTERGRHVDLARTDRVKRCLVFKSIDHGGEQSSLAGQREDLQLENPAPNVFRLTRALALSTGLAATLRTDGPDPRAMLARIAEVPLSRQFRAQSGVAIAVSYVLKPGANSGVDEGAPARMVLTRAEARIGGLTLHLKDTAVSGYPADIDLVPQPGHHFDFPDDLIAVLGRGWGLLRRHRGGWTGHVNIRGGMLERTAQLELMLDRLVAHLAATLAQPPARFHETRARARWGVALRRGTPMLVYAVLIVGAGGLSFVKFPPGSFIPNLLMSTPSLILFGAFAMRNRPRLEFPTFPRRLSATAWQPAPIASVDASGQPAR